MTRAIESVATVERAEVDFERAEAAVVAATCTKATFQQIADALDRAGYQGVVIRATAGRAGQQAGSP